MCYFLTLATPLTLSEVRSMLPAGLAAHSAGSAEMAAARQLLPSTQTVATLLVGSCSCDLVRSRDPDPREDERHLRVRYSRLRLPRERIIEELERHRRRPVAAEPAGGWIRALVAFVAEHARNAGPTLFHLRFDPGGPLLAMATQVVTRPLGEVRARADSWLEENHPVLVVR